MKKWRSENRRRARDYALKIKFGISLEQYEEMFRQQNGLCSICSSPGGKLALAVDHDHSTGLVRSLLCSHCNVAMERIDNIPNWSERAEQYKARHAVSWACSSAG
jgi:5-methylcytosine-specific restriction endonuclease McrA